VILLGFKPLQIALFWGPRDSL